MAKVAPRRRPLTLVSGGHECVAFSEMGSGEGIMHERSMKSCLIFSGARAFRREDVIVNECSAKSMPEVFDSDLNDTHTLYHAVQCPRTHGGWPCPRKRLYSARVRDHRLTMTMSLQEFVDMFIVFPMLTGDAFYVEDSAKCLSEEFLTRAQNNSLIPASKNNYSFGNGKTVRIDLCGKPK